MDILKLKRETRRLLKLRRDAEEARDFKSARIAGHLHDQVWYQSAPSVCCYVSTGSEVNTHGLIDLALAQGKQVIVPWCDGMVLRLASIRSRDELVCGTMGILEPLESVRGDAGREVMPGNVSLYLVPGLGFSRSGERIGYGRGYYDRLLVSVDSGVKCGLTFHSQILESLPVHELDVPMDFIISEDGLVYRGASSSL